jgi:L-aspartate oxidase
MARFDVIIIGSGLAGIGAALHLAQHRRVALLTKGPLIGGASAWAQGGIAGVLSEGDSVDQHVQDTLVAGAGLCDEAITRFTVERSRDAILWLIERGVPFTKDSQESNEGAFGYHLTREGGHSQRRIIHVDDATGWAVQQTLAEQVNAHPNITLFEHHIAIDLITSGKLGLREHRCLGAYALDSKTGKVATFSAAHTVLATGGAGKVYLYTTNPDSATGDGTAMGWRAGCRVANLEFIQFHPTCLYHPHAKSFLITEAVRGEGGVLRLPGDPLSGKPGERFMDKHDQRAELAPRDVVARAIDFEMKKRGLDCVYLDISHKSADFLKGHFPNIYARCLELGIDITKQPIPVVPAAHYTCGGLMADKRGRTDVANLYAVGEVAHTGLHGANRLASNSLLECLVFAKAAAEDILAQPEVSSPELPQWDESRVGDADEEIVIAHNWNELRHFMWDYVGIVRTNKRLQRAQHRIRLLFDEVHEYYANFRVTHDLIELRNLLLTADLIVQCALARHESRGLHFSRDYPQASPNAVNTILTPPLSSYVTRPSA